MDYMGCEVKGFQIIIAGGGKSQEIMNFPATWLGKLAYEAAARAVIEDAKRASGEFSECFVPATGMVDLKCLRG